MCISPPCLLKVSSWVSFYSLAQKNILFSGPHTTTHTYTHIHNSVKGSFKLASRDHMPMQISENWNQ